MEASVESRTKKHSAKKKHWANSFFAEPFLRLSAKKFKKKVTFLSPIFFILNNTYIKRMLKFGTILTLYAIFKHFTSF
jgi:hypothetical protein